ncbi:MAG: DNA polymerase III subunit beta [Nanoarchaeota archaeon]|nr:DNA polymerase III subunit beta [Nanoarchaeota archaeon]
MPTTTTNFFNITILRSKLIEALGIISHSVGSESSSLPILRYVLLRASGGSVFLTTTDLEVLTECSFLGKVSQPGVLALPFQVFSGIVKNLQNERITLTQDGLTLHILTDNYEASVYGQSADDFPLIPSLETPKARMVFPERVLLEAFSRVAFATQHSDIRPEISGVRIHADGNELVFVATDSFRLARLAVSGEGVSFSDDPIFTLPIRTAQDLMRILTSSDGEVRVVSDGTQVFFETSSWKLTSRLVQGVFPNYTEIIPREFRGEAELKREEFIYGVKIASTLSGRANDLLIQSGSNKKFLEVRASESTLGENVCKIPAKISGDQFSIMFNWKYVLQGLQASLGEEVEIRVGGADRPVLFRNPLDSRFLYVVMPIRG